jgi:hypothetical protein
MIRKTNKYDDDDGRVICNMDVEGMPWYGKRAFKEKSATKPGSQAQQMTRLETLRYAWYSILAGLLIVLVFSAIWVLFVLFCTEVWFR